MPWSRQAAPAISAVARPASCFSISRGTSSANRAEVVASDAGEVGPCSAWASRSAATVAASAVSSAITATSDGPASTSMPTCP